MIRIGNIGDLEKVVEYNYRLAEETEELVLCRERLMEGVKKILLDDTKGVYYVYVIDSQVVGQMMITLEWSDWRNGYFWWIQSVYVNKSYRRQGIFDQLYHYVKDKAQEKDDVCGLRLYVEVENNRAQRTYERNGMEKTAYHLYEQSFIKRPLKLS